MARFYDAGNDADLARVEGALRRGGIRYYFRDNRENTAMKEIMVAEEDMVHAAELLEHLE